MREETEAIREYYNANPQKEWDRLQKRFPYEKYITTRMMDRYIRTGDTILDIGGGPGHYSVHYAKQGHSVTLLDLSDENVRFAKQKARQYGTRITALQGDALWKLFHVKERKDHEWHYRGLADALRELEGTFAFQEFERLIDQVFA